MKKVIVAGHICLDITPIFPKEKADSLEKVLSPGKLIQTGNIDIHTGGAVANTGLAMKFLGADVTLMGKIGRDTLGTIVCSILKQYGADEGMIFSDTESTSYSVILAVPGIDRIFLHNPGANHTFRASDISGDALREAALFHFGYPPLMRSMYADKGSELVALMRRAKAAGAATSLDMASVDPASEAGNADWEEILKRVLPYVDFFVPSAEELCYMMDRERFAEWQKRASGLDITEMLDGERDVKPLAGRCIELGARVVLIKCGAPGLYYRTADSRALESVGERIRLDPSVWAGAEGFERSYEPDCVLSGTGAGDTSIAAFLTAVLKGYPLKRAVQLAAAAGASCVSAYDALSGLRPMEEMEARIDAGWKKRPAGK